MKTVETNVVLKDFRIFDLLSQCQRLYSKSDSLVGKENGTWIKHSSEDFIRNATNLAYGFLHLGITKEDKIAIIANNRPEWNFVDFGILMAGGIDVPIYPTISDHDMEFILNDSQVKYIFVSSAELYERAKAIATRVSSVREIYTFNTVAGAKHWTELEKIGGANQNKEKLDAVMAGIKKDDLATILYTSGTTGNPKGVMLSHNNLMSDVYACRQLCPVGAEGKALSFLPLNHVYERMLTYLYFYKGVSVYYAESIDTIGDNLKDVKPDLFSTVPRLLEKVYDKIVAKGAELTGIKKALFFWALQLGLKYEPYGANGIWYETQLKLANKIIFNKWREALGGNVKIIVSGGAALQPRLARVFWSAQIHVLEGYGLTETSPVVAVNNMNPNSTKFGTVGPVIEGVEVKIAEDGEILVKGPNVMLGYYKRPDATEEVLKNGWFHTGDIGMFIENRFLKITDRKKEIFKTSGGKYIAPQMIENKLKESPFIEQALVVGENQKYAAALIVPAFAYIKEWCSIKNIAYTTNAEMIKNNLIVERISSEIEEKNKSLAQYETIKKFELMPCEWSINNGEMTPKLSLKRKVITEANKDLIEKMFV